MSVKNKATIPGASLASTIKVSRIDKLGKIVSEMILILD